MDWFGYQSVEEYGGLMVKYLPLNRAYVIINATKDVSVYGLKENCYNCPFELLNRSPTQDKSIEVDTDVQYSLKVREGFGLDYMEKNYNRSLICSKNVNFQEYGVYRFNVEECDIETVVNPVNVYLPALIFAALVLTLSMIYSLIKTRLTKKCRESKELRLNMKLSAEQSDFECLHFFRGLILIGIIFFTSGAGGYPILTRNYNGLNFSEIFFFMYCWTIGVYITEMVGTAIVRGHTKLSVFGEICTMAFILICVGTAIDYNSKNTIRLLSVPLTAPLQRLGIAHFVVATSYLLTSRKVQYKSQKLIAKAFGNLISLIWCLMIVFILMAIIIFVIAVLMSVNCQFGESLQPPQNEFNGVTSPVMYQCNSFDRISGYINKLCLGSGEDKIANIRGYYAFTSGILGVLSTIIMTMIGLLTGTIISQYKTDKDRYTLWYFWTILSVVTSGILFGVSHLVDFNLWPVLTILLISSASTFLFSLAYFLTKKWSSDIFIKSAGVTSIFLLAGNELFRFSLPFHWRISMHSHFVFLLQNLWTIVLWFIIGSVLFRKNVRVSL